MTPDTDPSERDREASVAGDPLWYKDAVIYQLHVRSFFDSDDDGIGDFAGLTKKLDYLQDLGVTALWLLPFYPSPLRDDGYDIADYTQVNPAYGTLRDFKLFVREAHARGLRVITELVINHTSDQHPWFQRARHAKPNSPARDFYVWSDTPQKYQDARIIFKDFEGSNWAWDPVAKAYYWHRFYSHQPDLNFENPRVQRAIFEILEYWLRMGVDGLRLDAVPYLYEREGTNCENLPETHAFLKQLRHHLDSQFPGRMLLAEANQWPEDAIAYFGDGDECHTAFHFPVMPRLFMSIHMEDRFPIVDILHQTPAIPADCQWLIFLRNHDELTLEMVTDEERDYMYRVYARDQQARINLGIRRRLAPLLGNNRRKIELMNGLLCSLPGTPVIYYGDEIGMGDNIYLGDRHGVRTPMQWSPDRNAGFSEANPQRLYSPVIVDPEYLFETINVETQQQNPSSLLWWMKRLVALRQKYQALSRGTLELLAPENSKVLAFTRDLGEESVLMVANLSRFVQHVELDLSRFAGRWPLEMFGQSRFPTIGKSPYALTLGPHAFYWFALERDSLVAAGTSPPTVANLTVPAGRAQLVRGRLRRGFENVLRDELPRRRWFGGRSRPIHHISTIDVVPLGKQEAVGIRLALVRVDYLEGEGEHYLMPLELAWGADAARIETAAPQTVWTTLQRAGTKETGAVFDASSDAAMAHTLMEIIAQRRRVKSAQGVLSGWSIPELEEELRDTTTPLPSTLRAELPNATSITYGDHLLLKLYRRVEAGISPDLEISRFLNSINFPNTPQVCGSLEYRCGAETYAWGLVRRWDPNAVTGWQFVQDGLSRFFEHVMAQPPAFRPSAAPASGADLWTLAQGDAAPLAKELLGATLDWAHLLGQRTGEMHRALASGTGQSAFAPEPFSQFYQRSLYQSSRKLLLQTFQQLRQRVDGLPPEIHDAATAVLEREKDFVERFRAIVGPKIAAQRIRCHGDYQLEHILHTGKDFLIVDFEGEPTRSLSARRIKSSALEDVAGMVHSLEFAVTHALDRLSMLGPSTPEATLAWRQAADFWSDWTCSAFLRAYQGAVADTMLLPNDPAHVQLLLQSYLLEEAIYELRYALADAPERWMAPLARLQTLARETQP